MARFFIQVKKVQHENFCIDDAKNKEDAMEQVREQIKADYDYNDAEEWDFLLVEVI